MFGQNSIFLYEINSTAGAVQINTTLLDGDSPAVSGTGDSNLELKYPRFKFSYANI